MENKTLSVSQKLNQLNVIKLSVEKLLIDPENWIDPENKTFMTQLQRTSTQLQQLIITVNDYRNYVNNKRFNWKQISKKIASCVEAGEQAFLKN